MNELQPYEMKKKKKEKKGFPSNQKKAFTSTSAQKE
jgi:hypothetical protein